jgi:hypothetical protein
MADEEVKKVLIKVTHPETGEETVLEARFLFLYGVDENGKVVNVTNITASDLSHISMLINNVNSLVGNFFKEIFDKTKKEGNEESTEITSSIFSKILLDSISSSVRGFYDGVKFPQISTCFEEAEKKVEKDKE